jgi:hypothetical protein
MKKSISSALHCTGNHFVPPIFAIMLASLVFIGCSKQISEEPVVQSSNSNSAESEFLNFYNNLPIQTSWELQQARAATAKYQNIENAKRDGYADINVVVPEMGFHYLKSALVDANFDYRKPEILVYNREEDGSVRLVAVEYAIPLNLSQNAPPGFSGDLDVWDHNTGFGLWLLHAWVWTYNPSGVFNPTNPLVHLH